MEQAPAGRPVRWEQLSPRGRALVKHRCEEDHLSFTRVFFQERKDETFKAGSHHKLIGQVIDDVLAGRRTRVIINVPPGYTKAIDCNTPMWTPQGWRRAGDIRRGDYLFSSEGQWTRVLGVVPQGVKPAYCVSFSDGTSLIACGDHRWAVRLRDKVEARGWEAPWHVKTTDQLKDDLREADGRKKWRIPVVSPVHDERSALPIDPYLLGCWLGDGHTHQSAITTADPEIVDAFVAAGFEMKPQKHQNSGRATTYGVNGGFSTALRGLGFLTGQPKRIPERYLLASFADRLALLQGLCDTDGGVHAKNGQQSIACSDEALAEQVKHLVCSVGGVYRCYAHRPKVGRVSYRLGLTMPAGVSAFRLERKLARVKPRREHNTPRRFIGAIEPVPAREMVCFAVEADDHLFCAGRDLIVTHNTEQAVIALVARGLARNPKARFIHASFNGELVNENSVAVKDTIATEAYQECWPLAIRDDADAKGLWRTTQGGGMLAKPAGGPITGFRAGTMEHGTDPATGKFNFTGALVIDDPLKPDDAKSPANRKAVNDRWHSTFKSRLAVESVPVIVIMQRLHVDDLCGFLLKGGSGEVWDHLMLPVLIDNAEEYPVEWTHGRPIPHGLPDGPLWEAKHTREQIEVLKADAYTYNAQYRQRPSQAGGTLFKSEYMRHRWHELPRLHWRRIYVDTAQKTGERNDWTVFQCWGAGVDGKAYLIDQVREKVETPGLLPLALAFWNKHRDTKAYPTHLFGVCRGNSVEDKVSGTGLIQSLRKKLIPVTAIQRDKDKFTRAGDVLPHWAVGAAVLPADAPWVDGFVTEHEAFDGLGSGHDDQVDPAMDAVGEICGGPAPLGAWVG